MELTNEFKVAVSVPEAWKVLTDVERIAPLLPGAQLQEVEGEEYRGVVKVKVGPITAQYKGQATFVERDEAGGRVVLKAAGRDTRGQGNATAVITATMTPDGDGTKVSVVTDLTITGKVAQFGRGVLGEVSSKLLGQFVDALEADIASSGSGPGTAEVPGNGATGAAAVGGPDDGAGPETETPGPAGAAGDGATATSGVRTISGPEAEPVDLLAVTRESVLKRLLPLIAAGAIGAVIVLLLARRRVRARQVSMRSRLGAGLPGLPGLPSVHDVAGHLPLPSVGDLASHLPSVGELTGHLPDVSVADVQAAIRRHRH